MRHNEKCPPPLRAAVPAAFLIAELKASTASESCCKKITDSEKRAGSDFLRRHFFLTPIIGIPIYVRNRRHGANARLETFDYLTLYKLPGTLLRILLGTSEAAKKGDCTVDKPKKLSY